MALRKIQPQKPAPLPEGILESDTKYPKYDPKNRVIETIRLYDLGGRFGWCIATLPINPRTNRTYGFRVQEGGRSDVVTMGNPQTRIVTLYVTQKRQKALQPYLDMYRAGIEQAGAIRDRIGSRRAEGQVRRARGERSWLWSN